MRSRRLHCQRRLNIALTRGEVRPLSVILTMLNPIIENGFRFFNAVISYLVVRDYVLGEVIKVRMHLFRFDDNAENLLKHGVLFRVGANLLNRIGDELMKT